MPPEIGRAMVSRYKSAMELCFADRYEALANVQNFNLTAVLVGCSGILMLWVFKKLNQRYLPGLPLPSQVKEEFYTKLYHEQAAVPVHC